jgi:hypothetical protein
MLKHIPLELEPQVVVDQMGALLQVTLKKQKFQTLLVLKIIPKIMQVF